MRKVYRMTKAIYANDLSGTGAARYGGRWNPKGTYVLYAASSASLAMLEWLAHAQERDVDEKYCLTTLLLPESPVKKVMIKELPPNWKAVPPPPAPAAFGKQLVGQGEHLALEVPSVLVPHEFNLVINTLHPLFNQLTVEEIVEIEPDARLRPPFKKI